jgi:hypothetical protein
MITAWRTSGQGDQALQSVVRAWCATATADGIPVARQLELLALCGVLIGGGGRGPNPGLPGCGYCGADPGIDGPGAGHGGLCPNGITGIHGEPGTGAGGGGGGILLPTALTRKEPS